LTTFFKNRKRGKIKEKRKKRKKNVYYTYGEYMLSIGSIGV